MCEGGWCEGGWRYMRVGSVKEGGVGEVCEGERDDSEGNGGHVCKTKRMCG